MSARNRRDLAPIPGSPIEVVPVESSMILESPPTLARLLTALVKVVSRCALLAQFKVATSVEGIIRALDIHEEHAFRNVVGDDVGAFS